jgi:type III secretory pathway lipoprotein EscJ
MKQLLHHIVFCCMVVLCFTACDKDDALCVSGSGGDGNSIILDLASASLPVTRATGKNAKVKTPSG